MGFQYIPSPLMGEGWGEGESWNKSLSISLYEREK
jgi:hypothetical protein